MKIKNEARFDLIALGEVMLRLDPGIGRVRNARRFDVWEGGGEYNVARGLRKCFGKKTAILTSLADNEVGRLVEDLILQGGVSTEEIIWRDYDGVGRSIRNGLNFTERGFGVRGAVGSTYNFAASIYLEMMEAFEKGDVEKTRVMQEKSVAIVRLIQEFGGIPGGKALMGALGVECGPVRPPLHKLTKDEIQTLRDKFMVLSSLSKLSNPHAV